VKGTIEMIHRGTTGVRPFGFNSRGAAKTGQSPNAG